jgi:hypothetical protein
MHSNAKKGLRVGGISERPRQVEVHQSTSKYINIRVLPDSGGVVLPSETRLLNLDMIQGLQTGGNMSRKPRVTTRCVEAISAYATLNEACGGNSRSP